MEKRKQQEELYDHRIDPFEWTNVSEVSKYQDVKAELRIALDNFFVK